MDEERLKEIKARRAEIDSETDELEKTVYESPAYVRLLQLRDERMGLRLDEFALENKQRRLADHLQVCGKCIAPFGYCAKAARLIGG